MLASRAATAAWRGAGEGADWRADWRADCVLTGVLTGVLTAVLGCPASNCGRQTRLTHTHGCLSAPVTARLVDEAGQPMGPHRVWLEFAWLPGLAMSRALGDQLAHT
jgi:hypothetical protein